MAELQLKEQIALYRRTIPHVDDLPAYKILQRVIEACIGDGIWKPGEMIPPERLFAQSAGMSIGTVKKAMSNLVNEGVLYRRQGSGTFVAAPSFVRQLRRYYLFLEDFEDQERENSIHLHALRKSPPITGINHLLKLPADAELLRIDRVFREKEAAVVFSRSYFSLRDFEQLGSVPRQRLEHVPLFVIVEEDYHMRAAYSEELFSICHVDGEEALIFGKNDGDPMLMIKTVNYTKESYPFEYRESLCNMENRYLYRRISY